MANVRAIKRNFTGGEVTQTLASRDDLAKYSTACRELRNFICQLHGGARFRPGTEHVGAALGQAVLFPFVFNTDPEDIYVLVLTNTKLQVVQDTGFVLSGGSTRVELTTPYTTAQLPDVRFAQLGDVVYIVHPSHEIRKLTRSSHTSWAIATVTFASSQAAPTSPTATWSGTTGSFTQNYKVTAVSAAGEESLPTAAFGTATALPPGEWVAGNYVSLSWTAASGADQYNIYKENAGYYGLVGISSTTSWRDDNYDPDTTNTPPVANNPFTSSNYPGCVAFHQQRLWFGGTNAHPNTVYASQTASFENFNESQPLKADDSLEFALVAGGALGSINQIKWLAPFGDLLIGTAGAEFQMSGDGEGKAITPTSVQAKPQSYFGSGSVPPIIVGDGVLHVQRQGSTVRDLFYSLEKNGYSGNNLSVLADHLFDGHEIVSWAYQQTPDSVVWCVRDDGILLGMTYLKEHQIWGWHRHDTDGLFESVAAVPGGAEDRVYFSVKRVINGSTVRHIERMREKWRAADGIDAAWYVDDALEYDSTPATTISGLGHLEGEDVSGLIDGSPVSGLTVTSGAVTLPYAASHVILGLPYTGAVAPLPVEAEYQGSTTQGKPKAMGAVFLRLFQSVGGKIGTGGANDDSTTITLDALPYTPEDWGEAIQPFTGVIKQTPPGGYDPELTLYVVQDQPLPLNIMAIIMEMSL